MLYMFFILFVVVVVIKLLYMQIRVSKDDLEKERGAVMEECRGSRNAMGRLQDAHWALLMEGSKVHEPVVKFNNSIFSNYYLCQGVLAGVVYVLVLHRLLLLVNVKMVLYCKLHMGDFWELFMLLH